QQRVKAALALDDVAAIARVPDEGVVAAPEQGRVVAAPANHDIIAATGVDDVVTAAAIDRVVTGAAEDSVVPRPAGQHVVAGAAGDFGGGQRPITLVEGDRVVARLARQVESGSVADCRRAAGDRYGAAVHENVVGRIADYRDCVVGIVTEHCQEPV